MRTSLQIASALPFTSRTDIAIERLEAVRNALQREDWIAALRTMDSFSGVFGNLAADVVQTAYNAGHTKAEIARAFGIPVSQLRGMVAT